MSTKTKTTNAFTQSIHDESNVAFTHNNALTNKSTLDAHLDLFNLIGNRNKDVTSQFEEAYKTESRLAIRIALWARDVRGGAGERSTFRTLLQYIEKQHYSDFVQMLPHVPVYGRWDDLLVAKTKKGLKEAFTVIRNALHNPAVNALCAKWMPRKGPMAAKLRKFLGLSPKAYRKLLVRLTNVVETKMCSGQWEEINYNHVPSLAAARYQKAFMRHDPQGYEAYTSELVKAPEERTKDVKINASAVYPYDVVKSAMTGNANASQAQWDALPDFTNGSNILTVLDTSASMTSFGYYNTGTDLKNLTPQLIATSLTMYIAGKNKGAFHNVFLEFSTESKFGVLTGKTLKAQYENIIRNAIVASTNLEAAFKRILDHAKKNNVPQHEMPEMLLILSDMEFNSCVNFGYGGRVNMETLYENAQRVFRDAGYEPPKIVFWNLNSRDGNNPVTAYDNGCALVSGFSPSILKSVLAQDIEDYNPKNIMLKTVMTERYNIWA